MGKQRPTIGVAFGAGGVRGFAHIGVLKVLEQHNIPIDVVAGSSMGALVAGLYGVGQTPESMEKFAKFFRRQYYVDYIVPKLGFIKGDKVVKLIRILAKGKRLEELPIPVSIVAADLISGKKVVFQDGDIADAVRASISIPGIFVPVTKNEQVLVDGGVLERVPTSVVKEMGADIIIGIDVSSYKSEQKATSIYDVILLTIDMMGREISKHQQLEQAFMINPMVKQTNGLIFKDVDAIIEAGVIAATEKIKSLKEVIDNWEEHNVE
ncbi:esterase [Alkalihalobacillus alcalophilus ATCC 27647 = CGMCC 1.3604]|uniref:Esterase n=1 Tax=Alkalihalobacillus alcalophilus ATCC 27647 = CGMCC 1.3604 TaxID=1218173 RepID=A0A094WGY4_ALKAL|nr:patatin-like phospholipase family protein [Alkalihalobacillus alcalophilus]KGA97034.1 esterase [Alkalihalobacillus alcalophilus ATCC 27647 = CGMCC 1.3604]MED1563409.1 patatin-like phospholipase family protein [Alkalihalobacillus alcalophilus]THG90045.1 esterase [Alkalihalobacillus alcalophilus ATCC 27647 = CGMCC 1.3604]